MKMEEGIILGTNDCRQLLEARKAKETHPTLEPPEGTEICQHLDFSSVRLITDFWSPELYIINLCCLKPRLS